jgi:pimeloyl-ACP methyl ester carboxylesterase
MAHPVSILLPGMDGTGELYGRFNAALSSEWPVHVLPLPGDSPRGYADLADSMLPQLPSEPFAIVAESFSGPLAILLANRCRYVHAVVLCASFVQAPLPRLFARLPFFLRRGPPPAWAVRFLMTGPDPVLAGAVRHALEKVDAKVLVGRVSAALDVDVRNDLERLRRPLLYLQASRDRLVPASCAATIRALKPRAEFVTVNGPHLLLQANPVESWRHIEEFLSRVWRRDAG